MSRTRKSDSLIADRAEPEVVQDDSVSLDTFSATTSKTRKLNSSSADSKLEDIEEVPGATVSLEELNPKEFISPSKAQRVENAKQLSHVLSLKKLRIVLLQPDYGNCFYAAVAYCIERLPPPFNISYPVKVLRHKVAEYMLGHPSKFIKAFKTEETLKKYCQTIATTRMYASTGTELFAMANALQIKIESYSAFKLAPDGFLIEEHGEVYSHVIKIAFVEKSQEFLPIIEM